MSTVKEVKDRKVSASDPAEGQQDKDPQKKTRKLKDKPPTKKKDLDGVPKKYTVKSTRAEKKPAPSDSQAAKDPQTPSISTSAANTGPLREPAVPSTNGAVNLESNDRRMLTGEANRAGGTRNESGPASGPVPSPLIADSTGTSAGTAPTRGTTTEPGATPAAVATPTSATSPPPADAPPIKTAAIPLTPNDDGSYTLNHVRGGATQGSFSIFDWQSTVDSLPVQNADARVARFFPGDNNVFSTPAGTMIIDAQGKLFFDEQSPDTEVTITEKVVDTEKGWTELAIQFDRDSDIARFKGTSSINLLHYAASGFTPGQGLTAYIYEPDASEGTSHSDNVIKTAQNISPGAEFVGVNATKSNIGQFTIDAKNDSFKDWISKSIDLYATNLLNRTTEINKIVSLDKKNGGQGGVINASFSSPIAFQIESAVNQLNLNDTLRNPEALFTKDLAALLGEKPEALGQYADIVTKKENKAYQFIAERVQDALDNSTKFQETREKLAVAIKNAADNNLITIWGAGNHQEFASVFLGDGRFSARVADGIDGVVSVGAADRYTMRVQPFSAQGESVSFTTPEPSGTSFAAPDIGGIYLAVQSELMHAGRDQLTVDEFVARLAKQAQNGPAPDNREGYGFINDNRSAIDAIVQEVLAGG